MKENTNSNKTEYIGNLKIVDNGDFILVKHHLVTNLSNELNKNLMDRVNITYKNNKTSKSTNFQGVLLKKELYVKREWKYCIGDICLDNIFVTISENETNDITIMIENLGSVSEEELKYAEVFSGRDNLVMSDKVGI